MLKKLGCLQVLPLGGNFQLTHQHIPDGFDGEKLSILLCLWVISLEMPCISSFLLAPKQATKQAIRKPTVLDSALDWKTGATQLKITLRRNRFTTTKGRIYDSVLCTFMYFMGTQNEVFTNESI